MVNVANSFRWPQLGAYKTVEAKASALLFTALFTAWLLRPGYYGLAVAFNVIHLAAECAAPGRDKFCRGGLTSVCLRRK